MQGMKMGYAEIALEKIDTPVPGWRYSNIMTIIMKAGGVESKMLTEDSKIFKSPTGELYCNNLIITSPTGNIRVSGQIDGSQYVVESDIGGQKNTKLFDYPLDYLDSVLVVEMRIISGKAAVGRFIYQLIVRGYSPADRNYSPVDKIQIKAGLYIQRAGDLGICYRRYNTRSKHAY